MGIVIRRRLSGKPMFYMGRTVRLRESMPGRQRAKVVGRPILPQLEFLARAVIVTASAGVAELADALDSGSSVQKTWRFDSSRPQFMSFFIPKGAHAGMPPV